MIKKILLVEDDDDLLNSLGDFIEFETSAQCFRVGSMDQLVDSSTSLFQKGQKNEIDMAILDINLGRDQPNGIEVYKWLREHGYGGKVVFLTGHGQNDPQVQEALDMNDVHVFSKPIKSEKIIELIRIET